MHTAHNCLLNLLPKLAQSKVTLRESEKSYNAKDTGMGTRTRMGTGIGTGISEQEIYDKKKI